MIPTNAICIWDPETGVIAAIDETSRAPLAIDVEHHEIHEGDHYRYNDAVTINSGSSQDYLITTPAAGYIHFLFAADGVAVTAFEFFEGSDKTGTTLQTVVNSNRSSANTASTTIHKGTSGGTTDGTSIYKYSGGASAGISRTSTGSRSVDEMILKQATKYIFRITSGTASNLCNVQFTWYKH